MKFLGLYLLLTLFTPALHAELCNEVLLRKAGLRQTLESDLSITRLKEGHSFTYFNSRGQRITNPRLLARLQALRFRPNIKVAQFSRDPLGHVQAVGRDDQSRLQYKYHPRWDKVAAETKFDQLVSFGSQLPRLRAITESALAQDGLPFERVLAGLVQLLDKTLIRVGGERYARNKSSYGLTTLRAKHVIDVQGDTIVFSFIGKSGQPNNSELEDGPLAELIVELLDSPGQRVFKYLDDDDVWHDVSDSDVNDYIKEVTASDFSAKDFRTWGGTVAAMTFLHSTEERPSSERAMNALFKQAADRAANVLNNTRGVARKNYIDPRVFETYKNDPDLFAASYRKAASALARRDRRLSLDEQATLYLLRAAAR